MTEEIKDDHKREKEQIKASFYRSLEQIKEEFANEITLTTETLQAKHKNEMGKRKSHLFAHKESFDCKLFSIISFRVLFYRILVMRRHLEEQWKQLVHEREAALKQAENRNRIRMEDADNKLR